MIRRSRYSMLALPALLALVWLLSLASCGDSVPPNILMVLENADQFELLSLDPDYHRRRRRAAAELVRELVAEPTSEANSTATAAAVPLQRSPDPPEPDHRMEETAPDFHGWRVLGRTKIKDSKTRMKLVRALKRGAAGNSGWSSRCFDPRHGLRAVIEGKTVCVLICFECARVRCYEDGKSVEGFLTTKKPQPIFDQVLRDAGAPLAAK